MDFWLLKYKIKKLLCPTHISSQEFVRYLKIRGVKIGKGTHFFFPCSNTIDIQRPWLLEIGEYCKITEDVIILAHDYSRSVLRRAYGDVVAEAGKTVIGDNVFIGVRSTILMGASIGNNVIIGAGSVVSGKIPNNSVASGIPAKVICSLDEYYEKRKSKTLNEAVLCAKCFYSEKKRYPTIQEMGAFFPLYLARSVDALSQNNIRTSLSGDEEGEVVECFLNSKPMFDSFESFIEYVKTN